MDALATGRGGGILRLLILTVPIATVCAPHVAARAIDTPPPAEQATQDSGTATPPARSSAAIPPARSSVDTPAPGNDATTGPAGGSESRLQEQSAPEPEEYQENVRQITAYEPIYFLAGADGGLNAKFQVSLDFQVFATQEGQDIRGSVLDNLHLAYSQTSLWELSETSKPFHDSAYRLRAYYRNNDLWPNLWDDGGRWSKQIDVDFGVGHESNGRSGEESRSLHLVFVRPRLTIGQDAERRQWYITPMIYAYVDRDENPDVHHYRGYVDLEIARSIKFGSTARRRGKAWTILRKGTRSDFGSVEASVAVPLEVVFGMDVNGWLMLQYFGGYGESLIDYNRKLGAQIRIGLSATL